MKPIRHLSKRRYASDPAFQPVFGRFKKALTINRGAEEVTIDKVLASLEAAGIHVGHLYITFILFGLYLTIAVGSTTHEQLLRSAPMTLPLLNVDIPLFRFYRVAPLLFVMLHFYTLLQFYMLSKKLWHLDLVLAEQCAKARVPRHPSATEQLLPIFPFNHMLLGGRHHGVARFFISIVVMMTLVVLPIWLLLAIQAQFLPYHDVFTTTMHRWLITADLFLTFVIWFFIVRGRESKRSPHVWHSIYDPLRFLFFKSGMALCYLALSALAAAAGSWLVLTFPGDPYPDKPCDLRCDRYSGDPMDRWLSGINTDNWIIILASEIVRKSQELIFHNDIIRLHRNLVLPGTNLVSIMPTKEQLDDFGPRKAWHLFGTTVDLGGRDLSYADLHRSILTNANLAKAFLYRADLQDADLGYAVLDDAHLEKAILNDANLRGATLFRANLDGAHLNNATLRGAVLNESVLRTASLVRADLEGVALQCAELYEADFTYANLAAADLWRANLQQANLVYADLVGTDLRNAKGWHAIWPTAEQCPLERAERDFKKEPTETEREEIIEMNKKLGWMKEAAAREDVLSGAQGEGEPQQRRGSREGETETEGEGEPQQRRGSREGETETELKTCGVSKEELGEKMARKLVEFACPPKKPADLLPDPPFSFSSLSSRTPDSNLAEAIARRIVDEPTRRSGYRSKVAKRLRGGECPAAATLLDWFGRRVDAIIMEVREDQSWALNRCPARECPVGPIRGTVRAREAGDQVWNLVTDINGHTSLTPRTGGTTVTGTWRQRCYREKFSADFTDNDMSHAFDFSCHGDIKNERKVIGTCSLSSGGRPMEIRGLFRPDPSLD